MSRFARDNSLVRPFTDIAVEFYDFWISRTFWWYAQQRKNVGHSKIIEFDRWRVVSSNLLRFENPRRFCGQVLRSRYEKINFSIIFSSLCPKLFQRLSDHLCLIFNFIQGPHQSPQGTNLYLDFYLFYQLKKKQCMFKSRFFATKSNVP